MRTSCKKVILKRLEELKKQIAQEKLQRLQQVIDKVFEEKLNDKIVKGAGKAKISAEVIARKWGEKVRLKISTYFLKMLLWHQL